MSMIEMRGVENREIGNTPNEFQQIDPQTKKTRKKVMNNRKTKSICSREEIEVPD